MYNIELMRQEINIDDHKIPLEDLFYRLMTDPHTGLSAPQIEVILARDGLNVITAPLEPPTWVRFAKNLFGGFSLLLWLGALLSFAHYSIETGIQAEAASENLVLGRRLNEISYCFKILRSSKLY
jgi:sodium/potassium-transporting ATPase subunit alpha